MAYTRVNWEDLPSTNTPRNATNLNKMDAGIKDNDDRIKVNEDKLLGNSPMGSIVVDDINCKNLCNGINQDVYLNNAVNSCGASSDNTGLYIKTNGGNYTISTTSSQTRYRVACINNIPSSTTQTAYNGVNKDGTSDSITIDTTGYNYLVVNATDLTKIQVEVGDTATEYVEFKQPVMKTSIGVKENAIIYANDFKCKNLYNENTDLIGYIINTSGGIVVTGNYRTSQLIPVQPNTTYTVSRLYNSSAQGAEDLMRVAYYQQNGTFIERPNSSDKPWTITTPSNCYYMRLSYNYISNNVTANSQVQLEIGEATPYTPYKEISVEDTGWVDLSSYVNTTNFTIRSGFNPQARKIGNMVFFKGAVYCTTAPNSNITNLLTNIPNQFRPSQEIASAGARYGSTTPFRIWYEEGNIKIQEASNIPTTQYYQGYALSSLAPYLVN